MNGETFANYIRKNTSTNSSTLTDSDLLLFANIEKDSLAEFINKEVNEDYFQMTLKRNLKAGVREYTVPNDILRNLKRTSAKLDGTNWQVLWETDITQFDDPLVSEDNVQDEFADRKAGMDIQGEVFRILSGDAIEDVTNGLEIEAMIYPSNLTTAEISGARKGVDLSTPATDTEHAMPRAIQKVWALQTSIAYKQSRPKALPLNPEEQNIENMREEAKRNLRIRNLDESLVPTSPDNNGLDY